MAKAHKHRWWEFAWSLDGPIRFLIECKVCLKTQHVLPNKRKRKVPEGMTAERFEQFKDLAQEPELLEAFRERLATVTSTDYAEAAKKGLVPPLPTPENLTEYRARTAIRAERFQRKAA
jgi:hypothetical protein